MYLNFSDQYYTLKKYNIDDVYSCIDKNDTKSRVIFNFNGNKFKVKLTSIRYQVFKNQLACYNCDIKGSYFLLQHHLKVNKQDKHAAHFNLYAEDLNNINNGYSILMTIDHITPKSLGGEDVLSNLVTMCYFCNQNKKNTPIEIK